MRKSSARAPSRKTAWARMPQGPGEQVLGTQLGQQVPQLPGVGRLDVIAPDLDGSFAPVTSGEPPEPGPGQGGPGVGRVKTIASIALSREGEHGVRPGGDLAVQVSREVHAEEREPGVRNRIDEGADPALRLGAQAVVVAPEGDDANPASLLGVTGQPVALQAAAGDHAVRLDVPVRRSQQQNVALAEHGGDRVAEEEGAAGALDGGGQRLRDRTVVDHARARNPQRRHASDVGLVLGDLGTCDPPDIGDAVAPGAFQDRVERRNLAGVARDDDFAVDPIRNRVARQKRISRSRPSRQSFALSDPGR